MNLEKFAVLLILALFYGIYYTKMFIQKCRGIRTHQIGRRKEKEIHIVEMLMSAATVGIVAVQLISIFSEWNYAPKLLRHVGFFIAATGDFIFLVSVICMKDSWRAGIPDKDKTSLITGGIYNISRNPAFLGFDMMYLGVLFIYFNPSTAFFTLFAIVMLHLQILQEEKYMEHTFGTEYMQYKRKTRRYLGRRKI